MGKKKRAGYIFIFRLNDHEPRHVHIYKDKLEIAKWNLDNWCLMSGKVNRRIKKALSQLRKDGFL